MKFGDAERSFARSLINYISDLKRFRSSAGLQWPGKSERAFRYFLEDRLCEIRPSLVRSNLIPRSVEAQRVISEKLSLPCTCKKCSKASATGTKSSHTIKEPSSHGWHSKAGLRYEHSVPLSVLFKILSEFSGSEEEVFDLIEKCYRITWITLEEEKNKSLKKDRMPEGWKPGDDPMARYRESGIKIFGEEE